MTAVPGMMEIRKAILEGAAEPAAMIRAAYQRACAREPYIQAFSYLPEPLDDAAHSPSTPLAGIAVAVKDLMDVAAMPASYGSPIYQDHWPRESAQVVQRLLRLGATILGKSVTTEFAWKHPGKTRNPWNLRHTPGGSSSGSAAAVAAGVVPLALGTQTFGSIIRPAAYCGVVGFKPSMGSLSRQGVYPLARSLDQVGFFTRSVADARLAWTHLRETPPGAAAARHSLRIGVLQGSDWEASQACQAGLLKSVADKLKHAGASIIDLPLPPEFSIAWESAHRILAVEAREVHQEHLASHPGLVSAALAELVESGSRIARSDYLCCLARQAGLRERFAQWFEEWELDCLMTAPVAGEAPFGLASTGDPHFCIPFTLIGAPAICIPAGFGPAGLPLGVQLVGLNDRDDGLIDAAQWCEGVIAGGMG